MRRVEELCRVCESPRYPALYGLSLGPGAESGAGRLQQGRLHRHPLLGRLTDAERRVLCIEPPGAWQEEPLAYLQFTAYGDKLPTHRDYLGSILGLGLGAHLWEICWQTLRMRIRFMRWFWPISRRLSRPS